eukprot:UN11821
MSKDKQSQLFGRDIKTVQVHKGYDQRLENKQLDPLPENSHVARAHAPIYRQAYPYVEGSNKGLYFTYR